MAKTSFAVVHTNPDDPDIITSLVVLSNEDQANELAQHMNDEFVRLGFSDEATVFEFEPQTFASAKHDFDMFIEEEDAARRGDGDEEED